MAATCNKKRELDAPKDGRIETGVTQFDGDWPGYFIRGDNALVLGTYLKGLINSLGVSEGNTFCKSALKSFAEELLSVRI